MTLARALEISPELKKNYQEDARVKRLIDTSRALEGLPRHASTHAAGVLITDKPVTDYVPLQRNDEVITTQFPMGTIEKLGLLKMDFLGLRTLTVIRDALDLMRDAGVDMKAEDIPLDDQAVYDMISEGETDGVFQLESGGMRSFLQHEAAEFRRYHRRHFALSPRPDGFHPPLYRRAKQPRCDSLPASQAQADSRRHLRLHGLSGAGHADCARSCGLFVWPKRPRAARHGEKKKHDVMAKEREIFIHGLEEDGQIVVRAVCATA